MAAKTKPKKTTPRKTKPTTSNRRKAKATTSTTPAESVHRDVAAAPSPVSRKLNDVRADDAPVLGHFVEIVSGEHKGRYGVFIEATSNGVAVVRTRDSASERLSVKVSDLQPAPAGKR